MMNLGILEKMQLFRHVALGEKFGWEQRQYGRILGEDNSAPGIEKEQKQSKIKKQH